MKAAYRRNYGPPDVIEIKELAKPVPGEKEVLIQVHSATVNRTDCAMLYAQPFIMRFITGLFTPRLKTTGSDFAGEIVAIGKSVEKFKPGDKVFGFNDNGLQSHAEYLCIKEDDAVMVMPKGYTYDQAAASIEGAHYAINFLNKVTIKPGDHVLINGGTGAIGSAGIQLIKQSADVEITATCRGEHVKQVQALGADHVIDYEKEDFTSIDKRFDFVFDMVGKSSFGKCKKILNSRGVYISSELGPGNENLYLPLVTKFFSNKKVRFPFPFDIASSLRQVKELAEVGKFYPLIDKQYFGLQDISKAFRYAESGQKVGNILLKIRK